MTGWVCPHPQEQAVTPLASGNSEKWVTLKSDNHGGHRNCHRNPQQPRQLRFGRTVLPIRNLFLILFVATQHLR